MDDQREADVLAIAVLEAVAEREDTDITELPPLAESINPEALNTLFSPRLDGTPRGGGHVQFSYAGYTVTVQSTGSVELDAQK